MTPFNFAEEIREFLAAERRPPDGKLHPSGDLIGSLRHAQLKVAGAPQNENPIESQLRLMTGTLWHRWIEEQLQVKYGRDDILTELSITGLPGGWAGTADYVIWDHVQGAWILGDLKTIKGEGMPYIPKEEHIWQVSAYFWGLVEMGFDLVDGALIVYVPMNAVKDRHLDIEPVTVDVLPQAQVWNVMEERWAATAAYMGSVPEEFGEDWDPFLTPALAPEQKRVQKMFRNKDGSYDLKLIPHWSAQFCPFDPPLCECSLQGQTKIGVWKPEGFHWRYHARKGYELIEPEIEPEVYRHAA